MILARRLGVRRKKDLNTATSRVRLWRTFPKTSRKIKRARSFFPTVRSVANGGVRKVMAQVFSSKQHVLMSMTYTFAGSSFTLWCRWAPLRESVGAAKGQGCSQCAFLEFEAPCAVCLTNPSMLAKKLLVKNAFRPKVMMVKTLAQTALPKELRLSSAQRQQELLMNPFLEIKQYTGHGLAQQSLQPWQPWQMECSPSWWVQKGSERT